jgi:hypothetical protein
MNFSPFLKLIWYNKDVRRIWMNKKLGYAFVGVAIVGVVIALTAFGFLSLFHMVASFIVGGFACGIKRIPFIGDQANAKAWTIKPGTPILFQKHHRSNNLTSFNSYDPLREYGYGSYKSSNTYRSY